MRVRMISTVYATARGTAQPGQLTPDIPKEEAEALIAKGYATEAGAGPAAKRETAAVDPAAAEEAERQAAADAAREAARKAKEDEEAEAKAKSPESVKVALDQLDPADDEDWTGAGKPAMKRIEELTGSKSITRQEVDQMFPDFKRPDPDQKPPEAGGEGKPAGASGGARTNKP